MNILVLGGTQMLGRDFVETTLSKQEHTVTLANRGVTNPNLFPSCRHVFIDRNSSELCSTLADTSHDIVIDFSCYNITQFTNTIKYINHTKKYILISTISVLDNNLTNINDPYVRYALDKIALEDHIKNSINLPPMIIVRPCAIYGDYDYTNRFVKINENFFWKANGRKADKNSGCLNVRELSNQLLSIINKTITSNLEIININ